MRAPDHVRPRRAGLAAGARGAAGWLRAIPRPLALLLAVAALLGCAWAMVVPPFQGPDESDHFAYVQHLAETGGAPSPTEYRGAGTYSTEQARAFIDLGLLALVGNEAARPRWNDADQRRWRAFEDALPAGARADGGGLNPIAKNPPLYYAYESAAYLASPGRSLFSRVLALRLANVLLFVLTVALTWLAVAELTPRTWVRTLAAGVVALQPQLAFMGGIVNADTLLVTVVTAFTALAMRTLVRGPSGPRTVGLFALAAAAALTHGRGLALLPALAAVVALACWRHRPALRRAAGWCGIGLAILGVALLAFRLFTTSSGSGTLYGGQTRYLEQGGFDLKQFVSHVWQFYLSPLPSMAPRIGPDYGYRQMFVETFYGAFGSLEVRYAPRVYTLLQLAAGLGLVGLYTAVLLRWRALRPRLHVALGLAAIAGSLLALLHLVSYLSLLGSPDPLIVGRYALPLIAPFAIAVAFVASSLPRRLGPLLAAAILAAGVLLQLGGLGLTVVRFYG